MSVILVYILKKRGKVLNVFFVGSHSFFYSLLSRIHILKNIKRPTKNMKLKRNHLMCVGLILFGWLIVLSSPNPVDVSITIRPIRNPEKSGENHKRQLLEQFLHDPSMTARCPEKSIPVIQECNELHLHYKPLARPPPLVVPVTSGSTTSTMVLHNATEFIPGITHHSIFSLFSEKAAYYLVGNEPGQEVREAAAGGAEEIAHNPFSSKMSTSRVLEFNGVHTEYHFDCDINVDFRQYHQVRAALCLGHEEEWNRSAKMRQNDVTDVYHVDGMFPLVDEEYMEYVMTLTTAYDAATHNRPYTFVELGARYGTWIVRAGVSYRLFNTHDPLQLLAVEGNCHWFRKMEEHVRCNKLEAETNLILSYAAPRSYNKVKIQDPTTFANPRAVSLLDILHEYEVVDMIDFDIQGFEWFTLEEEGATEIFSEKVAFAHFGTHSSDIEKRIIPRLQQHGWCVTYFYAGAHTKRLNKGHKCNTPFGPSAFNDGALGMANLKYYPHLKKGCVQLQLPSPKHAARSCYFSEEIVKGVLLRT